MAFRPAKPAESEGQSRPPREPVLNLPPAIAAFSLLLLTVQGVMSLLPASRVDDVVLAYGFTPARFTGDLPLTVAALLSPVAHQFLHGGWMHVLMNVGMLMAFGSVIEKQFGGRRFIVFFILCGLGGALAQLLASPALVLPLVGASGAISGLFAAALRWMQDRGGLGNARGQLAGLMPIIVLWVAISLFFGFLGMPGVGAPIAWAAHLGGFFAGLLLYRPVLGARI